jgi:SRSO17 transposase
MFVDEYTEHYRDLFPDVHRFEQFKNLWVGTRKATEPITWPMNTLAIRESSQWHHGSHHLSVARRRGASAESVVLADSLYGESSDFVSELEQLHYTYVVAIRSNHSVWLPPGQRVRYTRLAAV